MYNPQDTAKNNLIKGTGHYVPDDMDEAQTMRFQVMSVLTATACPHHVSSHFRNISNGVKQWTRRLKGKGNDKGRCDVMVSKFQCHVRNKYLPHGGSRREIVPGARDYERDGDVKE